MTCKNCTCEVCSPPELTRNDLVYDELYKLRDGRTGRYMGSSRGEHVFATVTRTKIYTTEHLTGMKRIEQE